MVTNIWKNIEFSCMGHDRPIPFYVYEGSASPFYACPKYMLKDEAHPNGHDDLEPACANRLSFNMAISIVDRISKEIETDLSDGVVADYTGWKFTYKNIDVKILEYSQTKGVTKIGILNKNNIDTWRS